VASAANITGEWTGSWEWTSCPRAFPCSLGTEVQNIDLLIRQNADSSLKIDRVFSDANATAIGSFANLSGSFVIDYGRSDVFGTCDIHLFGINDFSMSGDCTDHYLSGPGNWIMAAHKVAPLFADIVNGNRALLVNPNSVGKGTMGASLNLNNEFKL